MQAMRFHGHGEPESLQLDTLADPTPGPGQIAIQVAAAACNFADILIGQGKYQVKPAHPFSPGSEVAGTVLSLGPSVEGPAPGTRVLATLPYGGYATHALASASEVVPIPASMPFDQAAAFGVVYLTSYLGLVDRARLQPGETLLVHAAAGGVGLSAVQIGRALGATVIASAGSDDKLQVATSHGASHGINYRDPQWPERIKALTDGRGVDVVYDPVGGDTFHLSTKCIAFDGRIVVIGFASGTIPEVKLNRVMLKNIAITGLHLGGYREHRPDRMRAAMLELLDLHAQGKLEPVVHARYPLQRASEALRAIAERRTTGKVVLVT